MLLFTKIYLIPHEILFPIPSISYHLRQPNSFPIVLPTALVPLYILVGGGRWGCILIPLVRPPFLP